MRGGAPLRTGSARVRRGMQSGALRRVDWAWIAQPDGRVQRFGIATWNRETQDEPARVRGSGRRRAARGGRKSFPRD
jgi:hypothetical protein